MMEVDEREKAPSIPVACPTSRSRSATGEASFCLLPGKPAGRPGTGKVRGWVRKAGHVDRGVLKLINKAIASQGSTFHPFVSFVLFVVNLFRLFFLCALCGFARTLPVFSLIRNYRK
jgi:hypothetical protein